MTVTVQKPPADQGALGSMSIRELVLALAALEDDLSEPAHGPDDGHSRAADTPAPDGASARERAIRDELRRRRLALRDRA